MVHWLGVLAPLCPHQETDSCQGPELSQEPEAQAASLEMADQVTLARLGVQEVWVLNSQASAKHLQEMMLPHSSNLLRPLPSI